MSDRPIVTYTVTHLAAGQPRPYADSVYEAEITLGGEWYGNKPPDFGREVIKRAAHALVHQFTREKDEDRGWWETYLDKLEKRGTGHWYVRIVTPYTD